MSDIVQRLRNRNVPYGWTELADKAADEIERLREAMQARVQYCEAEIERLLALKTPASAQLLNITKAALDNAESEVEQLRGSDAG